MQAATQPEALTDREGRIVWAAEYDPWGNLQSEHNPNKLKQHLRLPGQYHDPESGLYYNRHRYYDPALGSYISQGPIGLNSGEPNFYSYPKNPVQGMDPLGLNPGTAAVRALAVVEEARSGTWCVARSVVLSRGRTQLHGMLQDELDMIGENRDNKIDSCVNMMHNQKDYGYTDEEVEGNYNVCMVEAEVNYQDKVREAAQRDTDRHADVDDRLEGLYFECLSSPSLQVPGSKR